MNDIQNHTRIPLQTDVAERPAGDVRRALYLWERQPPTPRPHFDSAGQRRSLDSEQFAQETDTFETEQSSSGDDPAFSGQVADEWLQDHVRRLSALDQVIPGDRRLDGPRFSLMMLNAFLGRAATDGMILARLPGLTSIRDRIEAELSQLELEYPDQPDSRRVQTEIAPIQLREEMRSLFAELKTTQKAQQRQVVSSLSILHSAITELRSRLPDPEASAQGDANLPEPVQTPPIDDLARPLIDPERLLDPRPVLAAARAAASRSLAEEMQSEAAQMRPVPTRKEDRPYRSVLLGSAVLGFLMIFFGRDAVQFLTSASVQNGPIPPQ